MDIELDNNNRSIMIVKVGLMLRVVYFSDVDVFRLCRQATHEKIMIETPPSPCCCLYVEGPRIPYVQCKPCSIDSNNDDESKTTSFKAETKQRIR